MRTRTCQVASIGTLILAVLCGLLWARSYRWRDMRWINLANGDVLCFESGYAMQFAHVFTPPPPLSSQWPQHEMHADPWPTSYLIAGKVYDSLPSHPTHFAFRPKLIAVPAWFSTISLLTLSVMFFGLGQLYAKFSRDFPHTATDL